MIDENKSTIEKMIDLNMYDRSIGFYFSDNVYNDDCVKTLLVKRFTEMWPKVFCEADSGKIYTSDNEYAKKIYEALGVDKNYVLFCYEQKKDLSFVLTNHNEVISKSDISIDWYASPVKVEGIQASEPLCRLLEDLKKIRAEYVMSKKSKGYKLRHPVRETRRSECQFHIKLLVQFCNENGFSAEQLLRIVELCCCLEVPSYGLKELLKLTVTADADRKVLVDSVYKSGYASDKAVLITDLLYMVYLGKYDANTEFNAVIRAGKLVGISEDAALVIYERIKENG